MGTNESWLAIKSRARADVVSAVIASYTSRGAKLVDRKKDASLEREPPGKKAMRMGVAITTGGNGWLRIADSFGYTSDLRLARDLAEALETTVFRETTSDVVSYRAVERFGGVEPPASIPPAPDRYEDEPEAKATTWLTFEGVDETLYDQGHALSLKVKCKACRKTRPWSPGFELTTRPYPEELVSLSETSAPGKKSAPAKKPKKNDGPEGKLVFAMQCNECNGALGWGVAELVAGIVTDVTRLDEAPKKRADYDFALEKQAEEVERVLPSAETRAAKASAKTLEKRFAKGPREALTEALTKLRPTLKKTRVPLVSLVFAPDREQLVATFERDFAAFDWKAIDLPGDVKLQIVAWLGPKPKAPALMAFLEVWKKLLAPQGAFTRQGRDPKTREWITAVCTPLPSGDWAALVLFDQLREV